MLQRMVKVLLQFLKKKRKTNYNKVRQKVRDWEDGETRNDMYKEMEKE